MRLYTSLAICTLSVNWTLVLLASLAIVSICLHKRKRLGADDILISSSFVIGVALVGMQTWAIVDEGQGYHQQDVSESQLAKAAKSLLVGEALWSLVTGLLRVAAGLLVYRIFGLSPKLRLAAVTIMASSAALALASIVQVFLICKPFAAQWDPRLLGTCGDQVLSFMILECTGLGLDIVIFALPVLPLARLNTSISFIVTTIVILDVGAM